MRTSKYLNNTIEQENRSDARIEELPNRGYRSVSTRMKIVKHGPRITWTPLLALTAGGTLLRIFHLNSDLWLDEIGLAYGEDVKV